MSQLIETQNHVKTHQFEERSGVKIDLTLMDQIRDAKKYIDINEYKKKEVPILSTVFPDGKKIQYKEIIVEKSQRFTYGSKLSFLKITPSIYFSERLNQLISI